MNRQAVLQALANLSDEEFNHVVVVCNDVVNRLPQGFKELGIASREFLGIPEPAEPVVSALAPKSSNDVTVKISGVEATGEIKDLTE